MTLSHTEAMSLQATELERTLTMLGALAPQQWGARTECPAWDVRRMYLHVLGACEGAASMKEQMHQMKSARRHQKTHGGPLEAALSAVQVRERAPELIVLDNAGRDYVEPSTGNAEDDAYYAQFQVPDDLVW